jgi:hypothetical protein
MKTNSANDSFKDVFYSCIPVIGPKSQSELNRAIRYFANELYDDKRPEIESALGTTLSKEAWIKRAQRMVIRPDYADGNAYISIRALGALEGTHEQVVDLLAAKLMSKAPEGTKTPKVVVSSDPAENAKPSVWFAFRDGKLIPADPG